MLIPMSAAEIRAVILPAALATSQYYSRNLHDIRVADISQRMIQKLYKVVGNAFYCRDLWHLFQKRFNDFADHSSCGIRDIVAETHLLGSAVTFCRVITASRF